MNFSVDPSFAKTQKPMEKVAPVRVQMGATLPFQKTGLVSARKVRSPSSSYWSWALALTSFPFIFWGCPFFLLVREPTSSQHYAISSTRFWLWQMCTCRFPIMSIFATLLVLPTLLLNGYFAYELGTLIDNLFISGTYQFSMYYDLLALIRFLPVILPLNYVWFRGYHINNMICRLNHMHRKYGEVGYSFRLRLCIMLCGILVVHVIRYFIYDKYMFNSVQNWGDVEEAMEFSIDIFCSLLLPLYCTFCYAVRFQLLVIKGFIYKLIANRVVPQEGHLTKIKSLYTQAADNILVINDLFSKYISLALLILIIGTIIDAQDFWKAVAGLIPASPLKPLINFLTRLANPEGETQSSEEEKTTTDIREINADLLCVAIIYTLISVTMWQAVNTNDCAREINVWINDLVTGGTGTDVTAVLHELGLLKEEVSGRSIEDVDEPQFPSVWARDEKMEHGVTDDFIRKVNLMYK